MHKYAGFQVLSAELAPGINRERRRALGYRQTASVRREAHRAHFDYTPRPGFLYVRCRAISSRCNDNFDDFPADEIKKAYRTFVGKPVFVNHKNDNHRRARGVVIDAALHEDTNPDGTPDVWVETLHEIDAIKFPKLCQAIIAGESDRTSMGTDVAYSVCSYCGNKATTPLEYCAHIPKLKGQRIYRTTASGQREGVLVREICYGLSFFENSHLVEEPADPTAFVLGMEGEGVTHRVAKRSDAIHPTAAVCPGTGCALDDGKCPGCHIRIRTVDGKIVSHAYPYPGPRPDEPARNSQWLGALAGQATTINRDDFRHWRITEIEDPFTGEIRRTADWDERKHPRGQPTNSGEFAKTPGGGGPKGGDSAPSGGSGGKPPKSEAGDPEAPPDNQPGGKLNPIHTDDVAEAARLLHEGKYVRLKHVRQVSTLLDKLAAEVKAAKAAGTQAGLINLCKVSVENTNLFCAENRGIPRVEMPQFTTKEPVPGSKADKLERGSDGGVDLAPFFREHLTKKGISIKLDTVPANVLKASQNELRGDKVAGMTEAVEAGTMPPGRIFVSNDDYVIDGHHRWAANIGADTANEQLGDIKMDVEVIDMSIVDVLKEANDFCDEWGVPQMSMAARLAAANPQPGDMVTVNDERHLYHGHQGRLTGFRAGDAEVACFSCGSQHRLDYTKLVKRATLKNLAWGEKHKTKTFPPGTPSRDVDQWISKLPKKVQPLVERVNGSDGTTIVSVTWPADDFNPSMYVRDDYWDAMVPAADWNVGEYVKMRDLKVGDTVSLQGSEGPFFEVGQVTDNGIYPKGQEGQPGKLIGFMRPDSYGRGTGPNKWYTDRTIWRRTPQPGREHAYGPSQLPMAAARADWGPKEQGYYREGYEIGQQTCASGGHLSEEVKARMGKHGDFAAGVREGLDSCKTASKLGAQSDWTWTTRNGISDGVYMRRMGDYNFMVWEAAAEPGSWAWTATYHDYSRPGLNGDGGYDSAQSAMVAAESRGQVLAKKAYGETLAPADVDTLREEACPVCGEEDAYDGERCLVCQFVKPPDIFMDPDLDAAKANDLRQEQDDERLPGAGDLVCPECGDTFASPAEGGQPEQLDHFIPPGGPDPAEDQVNKTPDATAPDASGTGTVPVKTVDPSQTFNNSLPQNKPAPTTDKTDKTGEPETAPKEGDDCPTCGKGKLVSKDTPTPPPAKADAKDDGKDEDKKDGGDDKDGEDDKSKPPWLKDKKKQSHQAAAAASTQKEQSMRPALAALAEQQRQINALRTGFQAIASLAGLERHPIVVQTLGATDPRRVEAILKQADENNPAQPIPEPAAEAPVATTQETRAPDATDDPNAIGASPLTDVGADATTNPTEEGGTVLDEPLNLNEVDVTAPVAGTETLGEGAPGAPGTNRTETDVQVGTPTNDAAFTETGWTTGARTWASLRLARLRMQAGVADGDDLEVGQMIDASPMTDEAIAGEIETLSKVVQVNASRQQRPAPQGQRPPSHLVPRAAARAVPSMATMGAEAPVVAPVQTIVGAPEDEEFAFE